MKKGGNGMKENKCLRCQHSWIPRKAKSPRCPKCGSSLWNVSEEKTKKIPRKCDICNHCFKPQTDRQWEINRYIHEKLSVKHQKYLKLNQN